MHASETMDLMSRYIEKTKSGLQKGTLREGIRDIQTGFLQLDSTEGDCDSILVVVENVDTGLTLGTLTDKIARKAGYKNAEAVRADLRHIYVDQIGRYPDGMSDDHPITFARWSFVRELPGVRPNAPEGPQSQEASSPAPSF